MRTDIDIALAGFTLNVGAANASTLGQAGLILNAGAHISGGTVNIGTNALNVYVEDTKTSTISAPITNFRSNVNNTLSTSNVAAPAVLVKFGGGTLELSGANTFQGNVQVNAGTLSLKAANVMPTFGNLNAVTGSIVTIQPGGTVKLNGFNQEFGNLSGTSVVSGALSTGGVLDLGSATLVVGREGSSQTFSGQIIGGAGSVLTKVGGGRLTLNNWDTSMPNSLGTLDIAQGFVQSWINDQSWATPTGFASAIPSSTTILLRGGQWEAYAIGDSTGNSQRIVIGNNVIHQGGDSQLIVNRPTGSGSSKLLVFGTLQLDVQRFLSTGGNTYIPRFDGLTTLTNHARIQNDVQLVLAGGITDGGKGYTINKIGGSDLTISGDNSSTWSGGIVVSAGTLFFGNRGTDDVLYPGVTFVPSSTANMGSGDIVANQAFTINNGSTTAIRLNAPTNVLAGQDVLIFGSEVNHTVRVDIGTDAPLTSYNLRSTMNGALALGIGDAGLFTQALDQSKMGSGKWGISAYATTFYMADTLGAGVDNVYRFTGTNAVLSVVNSGVVTGSASLQVGRNPLDSGFQTPTATVAQIRLYGTQDYTGNTTIFRGADFGSIGNYLEITGSIASPVIDVYGRLNLRGSASVTTNGLTNSNAVNLRPGGVLRLDYSTDVNDQFIISRLNNSNLTVANKWGDNEALILDGATLNMVAASQHYTSETVGEITVKGGAGLYLERNSTNGGIVLITNTGIVRSGQGTLAIRLNADEFGLNQFQGQRVYVNDSAWLSANLTNGMLSPWMFVAPAATTTTLNSSNLSFVTYNDVTGMTYAPWTATGTGAAFLQGLNSTSIAYYNAGGNAALASVVNSYAMRVTGTTTISGNQVNIHSGGLLTSGAVTFSSTAPLFFGDGTNKVEGVIYSFDNTLLLQGKVTAAGLTRAGPSTLQLSNASNDITGNFQINGGTVIGDLPGTFGTASITLQGDYQNNNNGAQMPIVAFRTASASGTFNNDVIIAENVPFARIDTNRSSGTGSGTITISSLTIAGTSTLQGTLLQIQNNNSYNLAVSGATNINGSSPVSIYVSAGTAQLSGTVTSSVGITKTGNGVLRLDGNNTAMSSVITLDRGEVRITGTGTGTVPNLAAGTGDFISNFGTIRLASAVADHDFFVTANQKLYINGLTLITLDRNGGGAANKYLGLDNGGQKIITSNSPFLIVNGSDSLVIEAGIVMNDILSLRTDTTTYLREKVEGKGRLVKIGNGYLILDIYNAAHTFTGGFDIFGGNTLFNGSAIVAGTGAVRLYAGAYLDMQNTGNLGATGLTQVVTSDSALASIGVRVIGNLNSITAAIAAPGVIKGNGFGILSLAGNVNLTTDPDMANRDGGVFSNWFLGGGNGNGNLTADSVNPWGLNGNEFRLGGGTGGTLTVGPATAGSAQFSGGNRMLLGAGMDIQAYGFVTFNNNGNNDYSGGTLLARTRNYDNSYRGFGLSLQGGESGTRTPLGSGEVEVFGEVRIEGSRGTAVGLGGANANQWILHPSTRIRFDYATPYTGTNTDGRWSDTDAIFLNGGSLELLGDDAAAVASSIQYTETVGAVTVALGADISVVSRGTNLFAELTLADLTRDTASSGTLTLRHNANRLGVAGSVNADRLIVTAWAAGSPFMNNGMIDPWIVSRSEHQFLKYDTTLGFQLITAGGAPANYKTSTGGTLNGTTLSLNDGTEILNLTTATATLGINADVYALRLDRDINVSADGLFNRITIRSGGLLLGSSQTPTINPDLYFGASGNGDGEALISTSVNTLQINGKIYASQVTKSGLSVLNIRGDQTQFHGKWVIQDGGVQFLTPNSTGDGTNEIILGGGHMNDNDNYLQSFYSDVRFNFNPGTPDLFTWNTGAITSYDIGRIIVTGQGNDRLIQIADINLKTTNTIPGAGQEGLLTFQVDSSRVTARTGTVTLYDDYQLWVEAGSWGPGSTTGLQLGSGTGTGGIDNGGLYDFRKVGDGMLILGDNSTTFRTLPALDPKRTTFTISEGGVRVTSNGAFGNSTVDAIISPTAALEIAVSNWVPTANLTQAWGSIERWAVSDARGTGNFTLADGVSLQVFADLTGSRTINIAGGSVMGYLPLDYDEVAVIQTIRSGVTLNLTADSYLGQNYPSGISSGQNSLFYDMGKLNTTTNLNPTDPGLRGSYLQIDGNITGTGFNLTKVGQDIIKLSGTGNTYGSTTIENGILQIGADNVLPLGGTLTTKFTGMFDLNGHNQEVAGLAGDGGSINNGAFDNNTLTVNQSSADTTYDGQVNGNVTFRKKGTAKITFTAVNSYRGGTVLEGGTLSVAQASSLGYVSLNFRADALRFTGGTLQVTDNTTLDATSGVTLDAAGGTIATADSKTFVVASVITGEGALTKSETGTLELSGAGSDYSGDTNVTSGVLKGGAENALSPKSRHVITGDTESGTVDLGGFNQSIGSLASTGAAQANATVLLGVNTLTVGGDDTSGAVYAGTISGSGVFRVNTNGSQTLSTVDNSAQTWSTEIANGQLSLANGAKLGSGNVTLNIASVTGTDDLTVLDLQGTALSNNVIVNATNSTGLSVLQASTAADSSITGDVTLNRDILAGATAGQKLEFTGTVSGAGRVTVVDGGTVILSGTNNFGTGVAGGSGVAIDGGTVIRSGTVEADSSSALGTKHVELGDTRIIMTTSVDRATTASLTLGGGTYSSNGGIAQSGSFSGVSSTVDGYVYTALDVGKTILVKNENADPSRNGIYTIVSVSGGTMDLIRHVEFDTPSEMTYGTQFTVTNGSSATKSFFMMGSDVDSCCLPVIDPIRFREEAAVSDVALLVNAGALTIANAMDVNATAGTGSVTVGGATTLTSGSSTFTGNMVLQNLQTGATGVETKTVTLTSSTSTGNGITFSGVISEADSANDTLSIEKTGTGIVTLTGANTYHGTTAVTTGTLQLGTGGSIDDTTFIRVDSGATFGTPAGGYTTDATVAGSGTISGDITIGTNVGAINTAGSLRAGDSTGGLLANAGDQLGTLTIDGNLTVASGASIVMQLGGRTLNDDPAIRGFETNLTGIAAGTIASWESANTVSLHDHIIVNGGSAPVVNGTIKIDSTFLNGYTPVFGDIFDLMDWASVSSMGGTPSFDFTGVVLGDGLALNTQLFASNGFIVVVPEPSKSLLLLFGLLGLFCRRRRRASV
ncbi:autotransporter-associated beta strand repeat-containing protein [Prosthecobacter sp.]|uniref:beta strand repeat-containing protein n=1 Tax=Prosthecobacter sp. TaxID=1965333 RepID=UPI001D92745B|nr:autotransporter-associated beta strand repeat-containing protein [Prosthecobacter sp.]MCB1277101.1 autotransporter-associated beta strand repeat-containing protein [Prosthecobacter sp.]